MAKLQLLHERNFSGKPLRGLRAYNDPFADGEICVELVFEDGQIECLGIGTGRPRIVSKAVCYERSLEQEQSDCNTPLHHAN